MHARSSLGTTSKSKKAPQPQVIDTSKYDNYSLQDLRSLREKLIDNLEFEEVGIIDEAIKKFNISNKDETIEKLKNELTTKINEALQRFDESSQDIESASVEKEKKTRISYNDYFQQVKERHLREQADLETERQLNLIRARERSSAKNNEMKSIAKTHARTGNIDQAISTREMAKESLVKEISLREEDINKSYETFLDTLNRKQINELATMVNNLEKQLQNHEKQRDKDLLLQRQTLKATITNLMRRAVTEGCNQLYRKDERPDLTNQITAFVEKKLTDEDRLAIFQGLE